MESDAFSSPANPFRVLIGVEAGVVPAWIARLYRLLKSDCSLSVSIHVFAPAATRKADSGLYRRYREWDHDRTQLPDDALAPVELSTKAGQSSTAGSPPESDLVLWLGFGPPPASIRNRPRVWSCHHGDPRKYDGTAPYFWEILGRDPVSAAAILSWDAGQDPTILDESFSSTEIGWSERLNSQVPCWRGVNQLARCIQRLRQGTLKHLAQLAGDADPPRREKPNDFDVARFFMRAAARTAWRRFRYGAKAREWFVAYRTDPSRFVKNTSLFNPNGFQRIEAPSGHFYADPFVLELRGRTYLLVEDYSYASGKALIALIEFEGDRPKGLATPVLDRPYHLSYPFTFEYDSELYMIPETREARRIEIYRATDGPWKWETAGVLMHGVDAVDTTIHEQNGIFYLFTNIAQGGATANDDLFLFHSDTPFGKWKEHPLNPICTDVRRSRSAGKLFHRGGRLIRPAQDCSIHYGYACRFNEVDVLSPTEYREHPIDAIEPTWSPGLIGTHTINSLERLEVIDGQIYS